MFVAVLNPFSAFLQPTMTERRVANWHPMRNYAAMRNTRVS